jgi:hypothetical protein
MSEPFPANWGELAEVSNVLISAFLAENSFQWPVL